MYISGYGTYLLVEKSKDFTKKDLGASIKILFKEFEEKPSAAASLSLLYPPCLYQCFKIWIDH